MVQWLPLTMVRHPNLFQEVIIICLNLLIYGFRDIITALNYILQVLMVLIIRPITVRDQLTV